MSCSESCICRAHFFFLLTFQDRRELSANTLMNGTSIVEYSSMKVSGTNFEFKYWPNVYSHRPRWKA